MDNDSNDGPSWQALARSLTAEIAPLPAGARIPTHRQLVERFGASATTVARALARLGQQGLIEARPGAGSFRSAARPAPEAIDTRWQESALGASPTVGPEPTPQREHDTLAMSTTLRNHGADVIDLNGGYLHPDLQPAELLGRALGRVGRRAEAWQRPEPAGLPELRDWFAHEIGAGLARHDVLITSGGQAALSVTMRAIAQPGDPVVTESPTYPGTLAAARGAGLRVVPVPMDDQGMRPEHLERALTQTGARLIVTQPTFQNPTGTTQSQERRRDLVELAVRHGAFLLEDDFARDLVHAEAPAPPAPLIAHDPAGAVVHIRSITKATSPNLRVAALAGRGPVMAALRATHMIDTMFVPAVLQQTALEVLTGPAWARARRTLANALAGRRTAAERAIRDHLGAQAIEQPPYGGYHLWVRLPAGHDDRTATARALEHGVAVTPGGNYDVSRTITSHVRLSYVACPSVADLVAGVERLGAALQEGPRG